MVVTSPARDPAEGEPITAASHTGRSGEDFNRLLQQYEQEAKATGSTEPPPPTEEHVVGVMPRSPGRKSPMG